MLNPLDIRSLTTQGINPMHFEQYLGIWSIEQSAFLSQWRMVTTMDLLSHMRAATVNQPRATVMHKENARLVQIGIRGTMTKQGSSLSDAGSTVLLRQQIRDAKSNHDVDGALIVIESGGGTVAGTQELADDLWELSQVKPTVTLVEDMMASAAMFVGSQSRKVFANTEHAIVGSMGTFFGMYDSSEAATKEGLKPILIRTGDLKGAGFDGLPISDEVKAMWQSIVEQSQEAFVATMKRSRKYSAEQMAELSRGGVMSAKAGMSFGLIDGVRSYEAAVAELRSMIPTQRKGTSMSEKVPATLAELKQVCKGAEPGFIMEQLESEATVQSATAAWTAHQTEALAKATELAEKQKADADAAMKVKDDELAKANAETAKLKAELAAKPTGGGGGHKTQADLPNSNNADAESLSATEAWNAAIKAETDSGKSLEKATKHVVATQPLIHKAYVAEVNANRKARAFNQAH